MALRLKRGSTADRTQLYFEEGELVYDIDLEQVFVGNGLQSEGGSIGGVAVGSGSGGGGITDIVNDTTPQLGGNLDLNSNNITGTGNIDVTGNITASGGLFAPVIDTDDSSAITITPAAEFQSDVTIQNNLRVDNDLTAASFFGNVFTDTISADLASTVTVAVDLNVERTNTPVLNIHRNDASADLSSGLNGIIIFKTTDSSGAKNVTTIGNAGGTGTVISQHDGSGNFPDTHKFIITESGNFGMGTLSPTAKLSVTGNATFSGIVTAASFNGTLVADDSTVLVDGVAGEIPYAVLGAGTAATGDVLKFDGASWIASPDLQGSGGGAATISGATQANPIVVTTDAAHGFGDGQKVTITDVVGMTELNGNSYFVDTLTIDTFALYSDAGLTSTVDGTAYTAYVSGGSAAPAPASDAVTFDGQFPSYYLDYTNFTNTPTTISGYGITDPIVLSDSTVAAQPVRQYYADQAAFPSATDWHGAIAHSHADAGMYFAHGGSWNKLANASETATSAQGALADTALQPADVGSFTFTGSVLDTSDSSQITITPSMLISSDLTVENNLTVTNKITADTIEVENIITSGAGTPELESATDILLTAGTRVEVTQSPFKLANLTDAQRDALSAENGDMIYNTDDNRYQVYQNGSWVRLDTSPIV